LKPICISEPSSSKREPAPGSFETPPPTTEVPGGGDQSGGAAAAAPRRVAAAHGLNATEDGQNFFLHDIDRHDFLLMMTLLKIMRRVSIPRGTRSILRSACRKMACLECAGVAPSQAIRDRNSTRRRPFETTRTQEQRARL
jgi:hypothetical protein